MSRTQTPADIVSLYPATELPLPGATLPAPQDVPQPPKVTQANAMLDTIDDAVTHALAHHDPRAYFQALAKQKPDLFYKYVALVAQARAEMRGTRVAAILAPLGRSALDEPPRDL
jgi:hypothetical protein